ncbi:MAG: carbohydrate ABC transporter permease [Lachnospiraceae bacterium]|nr:carbohydrate ABC transporter permease [Lachnospiraceae bacterium]
MVKRDRVFQTIDHIILFLVAAFCVLPLVLLFSSSLSNETAVLREGYNILPRGFDLTAYGYIVNGANGILRSYGISALVTLAGTLGNLFITVLYAYPISRRDMKGRTFFSFILFFSILFNGGLIPTYMMWTNTFHIKNSYLAYLLPNLLMNGFYVIMARNFFAANIPFELLESAKIDGAGEGRILRAIAVPMSKPILATLGLFVSLNYWNDWQNGLYYISSDKMYTIQVLLNRMLLDALYIQQGLAKEISSSIGAAMPTSTLKMAIAVLGAIPVLVIFPFISRYLTGGIVVGAVKG